MTTESFARALALKNRSDIREMISGEKEFIKVKAQYVETNKLKVDTGSNAQFNVDDVNGIQMEGNVAIGDIVVTTLPVTGVEGEIKILQSGTGANATFDFYVYTSNTWKRVDADDGSLFIATYGTSILVDIQAAYNAGKNVVCRRTYGGADYIYNLHFSIDDAGARFYGYDSNSALNKVEVNSDNEWSITTIDNSVDLLISKTYSELKSLRNNSNLVPGQQYRITDYQCTTTQFDTQSAGHQFDIIVVADDVNKLNENARAIKHSGDTYFTAAGSKLESWELKYCIDNDTSRFAWADAENGKGVIFYMKDEWNNECPYDFKNIQFKRYKVSDTTDNGILESLDGKYLGFVGDMQGLEIEDETDFIWCYTFYNINENNNILDITLSPFPPETAEYSHKAGVTNNIIKSVYRQYSEEEEELTSVQYLNNIVINEQFSAAYRCCQGNIFENECINMSFLSGCLGNIFGYDNMCFIAGTRFMQNKISAGCYSNTFGNSCYSNTFGNYCYYNTFGNDCNSNTFGNYCNSNTFGNSCYSNTFGNDCYSNTFGNYCKYNTMLDNISHTATDEYARWNVFEDGVCYVDLTADTSGSYDNQLQNITIRQGVCGTNSSHKVIEESRGLTHDVTYRASGAEDKTI